MNQDTLSASYQELAEKNANAVESLGTSPLQPLVDIVPSNLINALNDPSLMLQVIFFALFFGICMSLLPDDKVKTVRHFFDGMNEIFIKMVNIIMMELRFLFSV